MKFILETPAEEKPLTFEDVEVNQFFVTVGGELCQKIDSSSYNMVAAKDGIPLADYYCSSYGFKIQRILPKVAKIKF